MAHGVLFESVTQLANKPAKDLKSSRLSLTPKQTIDFSCVHNFRLDCKETYSPCCKPMDQRPFDSQ